MLCPLFFKLGMIKFQRRRRNNSVLSWKYQPFLLFYITYDLGTLKQFAVRKWMDSSEV